MTLTELKYIVAVAREKHFGKAAESCFVTQSTLSASLRELETLVGITLVERTRRVVRFTGRRVEADQVGCKPNEVLPPGIDLITDTLLVVGQRHGATIYRQ